MYTLTVHLLPMFCLCLFMAAFASSLVLKVTSALPLGRPSDP